MNAAPIIPRYAVPEKPPLLGNQFQDAENPMLALARSEGHRSRLPNTQNTGRPADKAEVANLRTGIVAALKQRSMTRAEIIDEVPGLTVHLFREIAGGLQADGVIEMHNRKPPRWVLAE